MNSLLVGFVLAVLGRAQGDYIGPTDWDECVSKQVLPTALLSSVKTFMEQGFLATTNVGCSSENRANIATALDEMYAVCRDSASFNISLWTVVHTYICNNQQDFVKAAPCMASTIVGEARSHCQVGLRYYQIEDNCRAAPNCVDQYLRESQICTADDALLFKNMAADEYTTQMYECNLMMH